MSSIAQIDRSLQERHVGKTVRDQQVPVVALSHFSRLDHYCRCDVEKGTRKWRMGDLGLNERLQQKRQIVADMHRQRHADRGTDGVGIGLRRSRAVERKREREDEVEGEERE